MPPANNDEYLRSIDEYREGVSGLNRIRATVRKRISELVQTGGESAADLEAYSTLHSLDEQIEKSLNQWDEQLEEARRKFVAK